MVAVTATVLCHTFDVPIGSGTSAGDPCGLLKLMFRVMEFIVLTVLMLSLTGGVDKVTSLLRVGGFVANTLSHSYTFDKTLPIDEIVEESYERIGIINVSGYQLKTAKRSLNLLFSEWSNRGLHYWEIA